MSHIEQAIERCEKEIEDALITFEQAEQLDRALTIYRDVETKLSGMALTLDDPAYTEQQRVLSYCLMRQANILRQSRQTQEAASLSEREIAAARLSGDLIALARSLMSYGTTCIVSGDIEHGLEFIEEAKTWFEKGDSFDHQQGLGWYWILQADLGNAGVLSTGPADVILAADNALTILKPIENWPGVVRAYAARAQAHEALGNEHAAAADREAQKQHES